MSQERDSSRLLKDCLILFWVQSPIFRKTNLMVSKKVLLNIKNVYTANAFRTEKGYFVGAGSETEPDVRLYDLSTGITESLPDCPGGMMSFIPIPDSPGFFISIMGLFPPFVGGEAGLYLHQKSPAGWKTQKALPFPFAHRCEILTSEGEHFLVAAKVSAYKENPPDWARPGEVHLMSLKNPARLPWKSLLIDKGITRNHGMIKNLVDGKEILCVSGEQGVFFLEPGRARQWKVNKLFDKEVSEVNFLDLDGDGRSEMVTIEPFHGNTINVYKRSGSKWQLRFSDSLSFGHGLGSGMYHGNPVFVVGNRSESMALEVFSVNDLSRGQLKRKLLEAEAGPTQTQVFSFQGEDYILSANQKKHEVALYSGTLD